MAARPCRLRKMSVQPSLTRSTSNGRPDRRCRRSSPAAPAASRASGWPPSPDRSACCRGRRPTRACAGTHRAAWRARPSVRHALDRRRAGADDRHALVGQLVQVPGGVAAGVAVVPAAGVEAVALEVLDARDARQLGAARRAQRHHHEARPDVVAAVGARRSSASVASSQRSAVHPGLEAGRCRRGRSARPMRCECSKISVT